MLSFIILVCIIILGISMMIFVSKYWESARLALMSDDAESVSRQVSDFYDAGLISDLTGDTSNGSPVLRICTTLKRLSESSDADIYIIDRAGDVVLCKDLITSETADSIQSFHCDTHAAFNVSSSGLEVLSNIVPGTFTQTGTFFGLYTDDHFIAAAPISDNGQVVGYAIASQPVSDGLRPYLISFLQMLLFSGAIALLVAIGLAYISTYNMVKPLRQMAKATKHYSKGDFGYHITIDSNLKELDELANAFNTMADNLAVIEKSRSSFVANVSHELKTPMTTIGGFIDGMLDGTIPQSQYDHYLGIVSDEVKRLSRLVIAMLNMSKIEAGQLTLSPVRFDISKHVFDTLVGFEKLIDDKKINISGLGEMEKVIVDADEALMNQVIYNLIDNAVKFTREGGTISFSLVQEDDQAVFKVRNTGSGIPQEELNVIFERFYKVDKSRGLDSRSFGLGLYIVRSIVEFHNGRIEARSSVGDYTEFIIHLPLRTEENNN